MSISLEQMMKVMESNEVSPYFLEAYGFVYITNDYDLEVYAKGSKLYYFEQKPLQPHFKSNYLLDLVLVRPMRSGD